TDFNERVSGNSGSLWLYDIYIISEPGSILYAQFLHIFIRFFGHPIQFSVSADRQKNTPTRESRGIFETQTGLLQS
ncbi:MAG: hypothetical protein IJE87_05250, partial [Firmicutes bacterium]|nr:hypothetical protein [Bacillota bacterium]